MGNELLEAALEYRHKYGFSIIPFKNDKSAPYLTTWDEFKQRYPTDKEIIEWWTINPNAMIAAICGKLSNVMLFDFDIYKIEDDNLLAFVKSLIPHTVPGAIASTPRGGYHRPFLYMEGVGCPKSEPLSIDIKGEGGLMFLSPSSNGNGKRYSWQPGRSLVDAPLAQLDINIYNNIIKAFNTYSESKGVASDAIFDSNQCVTTVTKRSIGYKEGSRNDSVYHISQTLVNGGMEHGNLYKILKPIGNVCEPPLTDKEIYTIIQSSIKHKGRRERGLVDELREFVSETKGYFSVTNASEALQAFQNRGSLRVALHRLVKEGILEKHPQKEGLFRKVEKVEETNWFDVEVKPLNIFYPFSLEKLVYTLPKSIIVIAGTSDAGKTAFNLNFVDKNCEKHKIHYFSSEMGPMEIKDRLSKFNYPCTFWKDKFHFYEYAGPFAPVIKQNDINIIDYLEIEDFTQVAVQIRDIFDKLETGICLISIQKKFGSDLARGGELSMEKARLYVNLDPGIIKIRKAKNWKTEVNPNGLYREFKLVQGHNFTNISDWKK